MQPQSGTTVTAEAGVCTPAYAAPEIARGEQTYDHRMDIYAVGCIAYWLLTGQLVFTANSSMQMLIDHASTPAPPPHTRTELPIPPELEELIMDCLEKDPGRRPAGAGVLAERLSACHVAEPWTRDRAEEWWRLHAPMTSHDRPVADVLLSREGMPTEVRALRPRRGRRLGRD